jgi:hypothetical protein
MMAQPSVTDIIAKAQSAMKSVVDIGPAVHSGDRWVMQLLHHFVTPTFSLYLFYLILFKWGKKTVGIRGKWKVVKTRHHKMKHKCR